MRTIGDKRSSRKLDRKVLVAEESIKSWADTDSESSSSSSSSSESEQEEVHCLMADQKSDDEVFDFSNVEFTREDLVSALNDMVKEYRKISHSFEKVKAENSDWKNSSAVPSAVELGEADSLKIELIKAGIGFQKPENSKRSWLKKKLDKVKAKAGQKSFVPNQSWRSSKKGQIFPSVPAGGEAMNAQPDDTQSDVAPKDVVQAVASASPLVLRPTSEVPAASSNYQLVSSPPAGEQGVSRSYHSVLRPTYGQPVASDNPLVS
ncbi:hypothetical protein F511_40188 [Dorcoceras hygrometricum]|uniref:Uncharacterized protein n=1 Tax=Dorcoceras hygrometricum TaxID=472368 RepID=A0A2Z7BQM4_9LAMI|nr:hypothetical protein F511_40188 [Dorcoceras hygrometricum]